MKRELGSFERALVISDRHAPFHIVSVLRLENAPPSHILRQALRMLQLHHPFLAARLVRERGRYYFTKIEELPNPLHTLPRWNDSHWVQIAEVETNTRMDVFTGPLFRCTYLFNPGSQRGEIIITFYHAIVDSSSIARLLDELLRICAFFLSEKTVTAYEYPPSPPVESRFPSAFRGLRLIPPALRFAVRQIRDEMAYRRQTRGKRIPPLYKKPTRAHILSLELPENLTQSLVQRTGKEGLTLNSVLNAALLIALNRKLYAGQHVPMRTFSVEDLRPHVHPTLEPEHLACYISMLRHTVLVEGGADLWELSRNLHEKIYSSRNSGDKFVVNTMTESLIKMAVRLKSFRMSATALNYGGVIPIQPAYENIRVLGVHGFLSVFDLGPEFSAGAQIFNNKLCWDFMYLDLDMTRDEAKAVVEEIKSILSFAVWGGSSTRPTKASSPILSPQQEPGRGQEEERHPNQYSP